jgi:hypothetical protein
MAKKQKSHRELAAEIKKKWSTPEFQKALSAEDQLLRKQFPRHAVLLRDLTKMVKSLDQFMKTADENAYNDKATYLDEESIRALRPSIEEGVRLLKTRGFLFIKKPFDDDDDDSPSLFMPSAAHFLYKEVQLTLTGQKKFNRPKFFEQKYSARVESWNANSGYSVTARLLNNAPKGATLPNAISVSHMTPSVDFKVIGS